MEIDGKTRNWQSRNLQICGFIQQKCRALTGTGISIKIHARFMEKSGDTYISLYNQQT